MASQLLVPLLSPASKYIASNGIGPLSSLFKGRVDDGVEAIFYKSKDKIGIDISDIAEGKPSEDDLLKLKHYEVGNHEMFLRHIESIKVLKQQEATLHKQDRESEREIQIAALQHDNKVAKLFIYVYSFLITILTFNYIFYITINPPNDQAVRIADTVLGFLPGVTLSAIIQFFYGSSK